VSASYWSTLVAAAFSRRDAHRPQDRATLRAAAAELAARGLTHADIAAALRLSERAVRALLEVLPQ
jgi:DNA-binding NarL/FixJ family response regulator